MSARPRKNLKPLPDGDSRHGTLNGYTNYSCRCDDCREAGSSYARKRNGGSLPVNATPRYGVLASGNNRTVGGQPNAHPWANPDVGVVALYAELH